jgi:hypothetical protein
MMMPRPKDNKKKSNDYRGGAALLKKQQEANTKKYKAMTPAQKKAYNVKQAKAIGKTALVVASAIPAVRGAKAVAAGAKAISKTKRLTTTMRTTGQLKNEGSKFEFTTKANSIRQGKKISTKYANRYASQTKDKAINVVTQQKATGPKNTKGLDKMKKALVNNVNSKNLKGKLGTTRASQPSRPLDRNIARGYALRKKFPDKFKP